MARPSTDALRLPLLEAKDMLKRLSEQASVGASLFHDIGPPSMLAKKVATVAVQRCVSEESFIPSLDVAPTG